MEMDNVNNKLNTVLGLFRNIISLNNRRKLIAKRLESKYPQRRMLCQGGYSSKIFKLVMQKDNATVRKYLRLTVTSLESVFNYSKQFLKTEKGWSCYFNITVFLYWLGCGASYRVTGASFEISRYTVRDIVHKCLKGFLTFKSSVIKYPMESEFSEISRQFNQLAGSTIFDRALGVIDGTHIPIAVPTRLRDEYMNRKSFTSLNLQAVCSSTNKFLSICVGFPGSMPDEAVLYNSELFNTHSFPPAGYYLLGDNAYSCRASPIGILTPYKRLQPLTARQKKFNALHSKARSIIENTFGTLKLRWRSIFDNVLRLKVEHCIETIAVACVMHNICLNDGFEIDEKYNISEDLKYEEVLIEDENIAAAVMRDEIANNIRL
ncbi:putative nuclease HARBI1 [Teleopsis dalmanni]|uniref:putative nuclease HARBI1 n=1 Tax=Teleopsis dalmanni TaxID=139649 RepID=UPI0018CFE806|nr:putative nuclease HARBI1 [Teleopsis dalmanni]